MAAPDVAVNSRICNDLIQFRRAESCAVVRIITPGRSLSGCANTPFVGRQIEAPRLKTRNAWRTDRRPSTKTKTRLQNP